MGTTRAGLRRICLLFVGVWLAAVLGAVTAGPASASCAADASSRLLEAPQVITGRVIDTRSGFARVQVDEIWKGAATAPKVWVQTGQRQPPWPRSLFESVGSSEDITLTVGDHYVIAADQDFVTNGCQVLGLDEAKGQRPGDVVRPVVSGPTGAELPSIVGPVGTFGLAVVALGLVIVAVRAVRHRGRPRPT